MSQQDQSSKASLSLRNCQLKFVSGEPCLVFSCKASSFTDFLAKKKKKEKKLYTWCSVDLVCSPEVLCQNHFSVLISCLISLFVCHIIFLLPQGQCPGLQLRRSKNAAFPARAFELTAQLQTVLAFLALGGYLAIPGVTEHVISTCPMGLVWS